VYAAKGGHLHVLQWAHSQDPPCPWDEETCWKAAKGGHLNCLQYVITNGCIYNKSQLLSIDNLSDEIREYINSLP